METDAERSDKENPTRFYFLHRQDKRVRSGMLQCLLLTHGFKKKKTSLSRVIVTYHDESVLVAGRFCLEGDLRSLLGFYNGYNPIRRQSERHTTKRGNAVF